MPFDKWYIPGRGTSPNKAQIRISKNLISLSKLIIQDYFKDKQRARIGYDDAQNRLIIMPTENSDKMGFESNRKTRIKTSGI